MRTVALIEDWVGEALGLEGEELGKAGFVIVTELVTELATELVLVVEDTSTGKVVDAD